MAERSKESRIGTPKEEATFDMGKGRGNLLERTRIKLQDSEIVRTNVKKMQTDMESFLTLESFGGNGGFITEGNRSYSCSGANTIVNLENGEISSFSNYPKLKPNEGLITFRVTAFVPPGLFRLPERELNRALREIGRSKSHYFILSYSLQECHLSERAERNLETSKERYNSEFKRLEL